MIYTSGFNLAGCSGYAVYFTLCNLNGRATTASVKCDKHINMWEMYNILSLKDRSSNFLTSAHIKPFGCACLFAMLLLIDLALFYIPGVFVYYN